MTTIQETMTKEEIRELNALALAGCTHEGASVTRDINALGHPTDKLVKHEVTHFDKLMDGEYGLNMKGRVLYNLNFIAQRIAREALRDAQRDPLRTALEDGSDAGSLLEGILTQDELAAMFGFETKPLYTVDKAMHWAMITYIAAHDVSQYTESDRYGMKSRPFAWMADLIRNPFSMVAYDAQFSVKSAVDTQAVQMEKFGYREGAAASIEKFKASQTARAEANAKAKIELIKQTLPDLHTYKRLGTDELRGELLEMIADLGINIPALMTEIADKYRESLRAKADEGKYLGDVDEQILEFCSPEKEVRAKVDRSDEVAQTATETPETTKPAQPKTMRRIKRGTETTH